MTHAVTLLAGEAGEATTHLDQVVRVIDATGVSIDWQRHTMKNHELTEEFVENAKKTKRVLLPFLRGRRDEGKLAPIIQARRAFQIFANERPVHSLPNVGERFQNVDLIVVRETTEDIFTSLEHESIKGMFEGLKVTTEAACERIARHAFELARTQGRKKVTIVHKANIMKMSDGLFLRTAQRVALDFPEIEVEDRIVDALTMQLTMWPDRFDILLCANLFGDIVADLAAGLVGGLANCPSLNIGADGVRLYSVGHGVDLEKSNSDEGNPMSLLFAGVLMLRDLKEEEAADRLMAAIDQCLRANKRPIAVGGQETLSSFSDAVIAALHA